MPGQRFRWEMSWLAGDVANHAAGHDLFVLCRTAGETSWHAVWRTMLVESDEATAS